MDRLEFLGAETVVVHTREELVIARAVEGAL